MTSLISHEIDRIGQLRSRPVLAGSAWIVDERSEELTRWVARGTELVDRALERASTSVTDLKSRLRTLSPQGTLDRGYAIAQLPDGSVLRSAAHAVHGTPLLLTIADGTVATVVDDAVPAASADR